MEMEEVKSVGNAFTWANNREGEGFVEEKLDRFFGASSWQIKYPRAQVLHVEKQSSDHSLLALETEPAKHKFKKRFCFDQSWLQRQDITEVVENAWRKEQDGTFML